jgi:hypothetical protein
MTEGEAVVEDYVAMRLTLRSHPVALIRHRLSPGIDGRLLAAHVPYNQPAGFDIFSPPRPITGSGN